MSNTKKQTGSLVLSQGQKDAIIKIWSGIGKEYKNVNQASREVLAQLPEIMCSNSTVGRWLRGLSDGSQLPDRYNAYDKIATTSSSESTEGQSDSHGSSASRSIVLHVDDGDKVMVVYGGKRVEISAKNNVLCIGLRK